MAGEYVTFRVPAAFGVNVYVGRPAALGENPEFGLILEGEDLPESLRSYAKQTMSAGSSMVKLRTRTAPFVSLTGDFPRPDALLCARAPLMDTLLTKIPLDLCVEPMEFEASALFGRGQYAPGDTIRMLELVAVRASLNDMMRRYDEICARYFED